MIELNYSNVIKVLGNFNSVDVAKAYQKVTEGLGKGWQEWSVLPNDYQIEEIESYCRTVRDNFSSVVVLGIGGSALGTEAIAHALLHLRHNELPRNKRKAPKFYVEDNIDPDRLKALFDVIDLKNTCFIVITKSGETTETLSMFSIVYSRLRLLFKDKAKEHIIVVTSINKGKLFFTAVNEGIKIFPIGEGVGGRFSVFSPVGLVPLSCVGIDIKKLISGARKAANYCIDGNLGRNPALLMAAANIEAYRRGCNINVLMPYSEKLKLMADFYAQLWGESLGKKADLDGEIVNVGQTPVKSLGVTDQHSQLQLYVEGPFDKIITFLSVKKFASTYKIPYNENLDFGCYVNHTLSELMRAEQNATAISLGNANRLNMTLEIDKIDCSSVGELITLFMYETAYAGAMLNVDAYDQPGVEEGKRVVHKMMDNCEYENKYETNYKIVRK